MGEEALRWGGRGRGVPLQEAGLGREGVLADGGWDAACSGTQNSESSVLGWESHQPIRREVGGVALGTRMGEAEARD